MIRPSQFCRFFALALTVGASAACAPDATSSIAGIGAPAASHDRSTLGYGVIGEPPRGRKEVESMSDGDWKQVFRSSTCAPHGAVVGSGVFGPGGGILVFGNSRLIIPGGALRDTVTISATIPDGTSGNVEFAPHGLQFAKSAGLVLSTASCELANPIAPPVVYLAPDGTVEEYINSVYDPRWKTIAAPIDHFSGYAIAF